MPDNSDNLARYHQRLHRVINYINANLDEALDLDTLAEVACLSRFHWHRIYRSLTRETILATVKRLKLSRASQQLKDGVNHRAGRPAHRYLHSPVGKDITCRQSLT